MQRAAADLKTGHWLATQACACGVAGTPAGLLGNRASPARFSWTHRRGRRLHGIDWAHNASALSPLWTAGPATCLIDHSGHRQPLQYTV